MIILMIIETKLVMKKMGMKVVGTLRCVRCEPAASIWLDVSQCRILKRCNYADGSGEESCTDIGAAGRNSGLH
jgi:hypothetical protein